MVARVREMSGIRVGVGKHARVPGSVHRCFILLDVRYDMRNGTKMGGEMVRASSNFNKIVCVVHIGVLVTAIN
jgi:hypothetical protein